jgi:hypothetical protein
MAVVLASLLAYAAVLINNRIVSLERRLLACKYHPHFHYGYIVTVFQCCGFEIGSGIVR